MVFEINLPKVGGLRCIVSSGRSGKVVDVAEGRGGRDRIAPVTAGQAAQRSTGCSARLAVSEHDAQDCQEALRDRAYRRGRTA